MTTLSDMIKAAVAVSASRLGQQKKLVERIIRRRQIVGGAAGAVLGGAAAAHATKKQNKKTRAQNAIGGAVIGGYLGASAGGLSSYKRVMRSAGRAQSYAHGAQARWQRSARAAGASRKASGHPFWDKVPEAVRSKARGAATHAKRTSGPEGETARNVLRNMGKKHGFDPDLAIKHAAFLYALQAHG